MKSDKSVQITDAAMELLRARKNTEIRVALRKLGGLVGYVSIPGEDSKVAAIKDWTAEIDGRFLK